MSVPDVAAVLRGHALRVTPQRRAILGAFRGTKHEHLSAEEVIARASAAVPGISRGTVYATLAELAELGLLASVGEPDPVRYETNVERHDHFRCRLCLRLEDVDLGGRELCGRPLEGHTIEAVSVRAEGTCRECREFEDGVLDGAAHVIEHPTVELAELEGLACACVGSPVGDLALAASSEGVVRVAFADQADFTVLRERSRARRGSAPARQLVKLLSTALEGYFSGDQAPWTEAIDWRLTPDAQTVALRAVQEIPYGTALSYHLLMCELNAYERGRVLGANPVAVTIPCHRVTRGSERLRTYVGGSDRLDALVALEADNV